VLKSRSRDGSDKIVNIQSLHTSTDLVGERTNPELVESSLCLRVSAVCLSKSELKAVLERKLNDPCLGGRVHDLAEATTEGHSGHGKVGPVESIEELSPEL
jgi:hypothetical protein